jgi:predicted permease
MPRLRLFSWLAQAFRRRQLERETDDEMRFHLEARVDDLMARRGLPRAEAMRESRIEFGSLDKHREDVRAARGFRLADELRSDVQYALRQFTRHPGFAATAILTLALGIGANATIFGLVHAILLRPLPYRDSGQLVEIVQNVPGSESRSGAPERTSLMSPEEFAWWRMRSATLSYMAMLQPISLTLADRDPSVRLSGLQVSPAMFPMLGVQPVLGRVFAPNDGRRGSERVVILSYRAWQADFGADSTIVGRLVTLDAAAYRVVGVMPRAFVLPGIWNAQAAFWTPLPEPEQMNGQILGLSVIARVKDGVSLEALAKEGDAIAREIRGDPPPDPRTHASGPPGVEIVPLKDEIVAPIRPALLVFVVAVGLVLLIACVNLANLFLARAMSRQREGAIRLALGAGRARIVRQLLTESLTLAAFGGVAGCALSFAGLQIVKRAGESFGRLDLSQLGAVGNTIPRLDEVGIDGSVLLFTVVVTLLAGVSFGWSPVLMLRRIDLSRAASSRAESRASAFGLHAIRSAMVVSQIALTMVLLLGAGLLIRSFAKLLQVPLGYDPANVLTFQIRPPRLHQGRDALDMPGFQRLRAREAALAEDVVTRLRAVPGVESAAFATELPMVNGSWIVALQDTLAGPRKTIPRSNALSVSRDYLRVMKIPVIAGRGFDERDRGSARTMLVNRALARDYFGGASPVGRRVYLWGDDTPREIVGVIGDLREFSILRPPEPQLFIAADEPGMQPASFDGGLYVALRTGLDVSALVPQIRRVVHQVDPEAAPDNIATMNQIVGNSITLPRMYAVLPGIFAGVALALALAGLYGAMAYAVARRTQEIGIRMALGAGRWQVLALVLKQGLVVSLLGAILGLAGGLAATRFLQAMLFGLTPLDPATFLSVSALFVAVAMTACYLPARRAARIDPLDALRCE